MKRYIYALSLLSFCFLSTATYAQKGLKLGGFFLPQNTSLINADDRSISDDDVLRHEYTTGMAGGLVFGYNPTDHFGMRLNVLYSQQGQSYSSKYDFTRRINSTTRLEYIKIPFMMGLDSYSETAKTMFSFYLGLQMGILTRVYGYNDNWDYEFPRPDIYSHWPRPWQAWNTLNYSVVFDTGFNIKLTDNSAMNLRIRGDHSILDAENKDATYRITQNGFTSEQPYWGNNREETRNFTIGLRFGITYTIAPEEAAVAPAGPVDGMMR